MQGDIGGGSRRRGRWARGRGGDRRGREHGADGVDQGAQAPSGARRAGIFITAGEQTEQQREGQGEFQRGDGAGIAAESTRQSENFRLSARRHVQHPEVALLAEPG